MRQVERRPAHLRLRGWREELTAAGIEPDESLVVVTDGYGREDGATAMAALLDRGERPDAVFAYNDLIAIGAMRTPSPHAGSASPRTSPSSVSTTSRRACTGRHAHHHRPDKEAIARLAVDSLVERLSGSPVPDHDGPAPATGSSSANPSGPRGPSLREDLVEVRTRRADPAGRRVPAARIEDIANSAGAR